MTLKPGGEVVLAAGAIGSLQILELSGIGSGEALRQAGIELRHEFPGVGENLQDHLQIRLVYEVNVPMLNSAINSFARTAAVTFISPHRMPASTRRSCRTTSPVRPISSARSEPSNSREK